ncbi:MAG: RcpC/CpaB family pilus assembly protein [Actinomycetota bacterium]
MRRVIAVVVALMLAGVGTFFLVRYVQSAEDRALEGEALVDVLVVDQLIDAGTLAESLTDQVRAERVPTKVAAAGAVDDLTSLAGKVAAIDLLPGEQVVTSRFITPEAYEESLGGGPKVDVPADMLQVTLSLSPERVVGGVLRPGDVVAVFASFDPFSLNAVEPTGLGPGEIPVITTTTTVPGQETPASVGLPQSPNSTKIILHKVLVTNVQAEQLLRTVAAEDAVAGAPDLAPTGSLLITLALGPVAAERLVFTAEHGLIWLALEGGEVSEADTEVQTRGIIYEAQ